MPPDQKESQIRSIWPLIAPVIMGSGSVASELRGHSSGYTSRAEAAGRECPLFDVGLFPMYEGVSHIPSAQGPSVAVFFFGRLVSRRPGLDGGHTTNLTPFAARPDTATLQS